MPVTGDGRKGVLVVAEAPGGDEDDQNTQLIGRAGQTLRSALSRIGVDLDRDCWKTNSIICRPTTDTGSNRTPTDDEIDHCRPNLLNSIRDLDPRVVVVLGASAVQSALALHWSRSFGPLTQWVGWRIPMQKGNRWICPTFHPSYVMRTENQKEGPVVSLWFQRHLQAAFELKGRPWDTIKPPSLDVVRTTMDCGVVGRFVDAAISDRSPIAFDFETNCLKPDSSLAEIVCCSICSGGRATICYPWTGDTARITKKILESNVPKIGSNIKFEHRWAARFGIGVKNWVWDTVLSAHHLDNRSGITSVKFQAFVRLGQELWDSSVATHLESTDAQGFNKIREVDLNDIMLYCGIDSLMEWHVASRQKFEMSRNLDT